ncbi:uncharacterized protein [Antedon mediterranea]|uniref:uncharacterized protein n=1 Tax=Antedon mediterranea TaxID=105859 RepID=UPI003AF59DD0
MSSVNVLADDTSRPSPEVNGSTSVKLDQSSKIPVSLDGSAYGTSPNSCPSWLENAKRKRRKRTVIEPEQLLQLESLYLRDSWPSKQKKAQLALRWGMSTRFVNIWFQNKRSRMKKMAQEQTELDAIIKRNPNEEKSSYHQLQSKTVNITSQNKSQLKRKRSLQKILPKPGIQVKLIADHSQFLENNGGSWCTKRKTTVSSSSSRNVLFTPQKDLGSLDADVSIIGQESQVPINVSKSQNHQQNAGPGLMTFDFKRTETTMRMKPPHRLNDLYRCLMTMMALGEGGGFPTNPICDTATMRNYLYGIKLKNSTLLTYTCVNGFNWTELKKPS